MKRSKCKHCQIILVMVLAASLSACGTLQFELQPDQEPGAAPADTLHAPTNEIRWATATMTDLKPSPTTAPTKSATPAPSATRTIRATFTPRPTATPRPTLAPIDFEALAPITVRNADQLARIARFELDDASELA